MNITADAVKQLRERTGAGMMECKKALVEAAGDLDAAAEAMRKSGLAKADKKASRVAAEGTIVVEVAADHQAGVLVEVNCETDFVAREGDFVAFAKAVAATALAQRLDTVEAVLASVGATYEQLVKLATELNWWPTPEAYPTANDLTDDLKKWVIRNKRGIGRAVMKAGGAL